MKLKHFEHYDGYRFLLIFENGEVKEADLADLIGQHVSLDALNTACIDPEWGCLEFNGGKVDIEPMTLYRYVTGGHYQEVSSLPRSGVGMQAATPQPHLKHGYT